MKAVFIYRMDDITPAMNWEQFYKYISLFESNKVKPLLGIVPYNQDSQISNGPVEENFWEIMRKLGGKGLIEFAQHGFSHEYLTNQKTFSDRLYGYSGKSEFRGLSFKEQYNRIEKGKELLQKEGIHTDIWMSPSHSYDRSTLEALKQLGFKYVTDGIALFPFTKSGLTFVPQQLWEPQKYFCGTVTICLHINEQDDELFKRIKAHLISGAEVVPFSSALERKIKNTDMLVNILYKVFFILRRFLKVHKLKNHFRMILKI